MSSLSTRSGRMVKKKQKTDAEYINGKQVKSLVNPDSPLKQEKATKGDPVNKTSSLLSSAKGNVQITDNVSEEAAAETKIGLRKTEVAGPEILAAVKKEDDVWKTPGSAVRRSGRAPVPSSKYKDMELDLTKSKKRLYSGIEVNKSTQDHTDVSAEIQIPTVVLEGGSILDNEDEKRPLIEAGPHKEMEGMESNNTELLEIQIVDSCGQSAVPESSLSTTGESLNSNPEMTAACPRIQIGGQQLTFTEHDGETVAVVTISSSPMRDQISQALISMGSHAQEQGVSLEVVDSEQRKQHYADLVTVSPVVRGAGHVVRRDFVEAPFATVIGHDGATYLNLSVEATNISSILKGKHVNTSAKSNNPLKSHGRVLRNPVGSMIVKTTLVPPRVMQEEPTVTYSLFGSKKPQAANSRYLAPKSVTLPAAVASSHLGQSPQTIVIRQKLSQKTSTGAPQVMTTQDENALTLINVSQAQPAHEITSACSIDDSDKTVSPVPKTASQILLQKLKMQSNVVSMNELVRTRECSTQVSDVNDIEANNGNEEQASQQDISESSLHLDMSEMSYNGSSEVIVVSSNVVVDSSSENKTVEINTSELSVDGHDDKLSKDLGSDSALGESLEAETGQHSTAHSLDQIPAPDLLGSTDILEDSLVIHTSDNSPEISSTHPDQTNVYSKEMQTSTSSEDVPVLTEITSAEQNTLTDRSNLSSAVTSLLSEVVGARKDEFIKKITVVDNGVEYDVRIVSEEEVTEEIIDSAAAQILQQSAGIADEVEAEIKQETGDDTGEMKLGIEKQSSSTQTVYSPKIQSTGVAGTNATTTHTLTTVVDEGSEKKHVYYVSVVPNKGIMAKSKTSMYSSAACWVVNDNGMYCCEKCDYQTDRKANFYKHRKSHTGAKPHTCSVCEYKAGTSSNLKRHMGIHKDIREHRCDICGLCFRQKIHLERHIKYKHEEKSIKCPLCDYICANEQPDLKMHIRRKHSNENSGEMVTKDLKQHLKFHRDGPELKLFCKECSFVTDCQSRLKRHTAIHSKMKPFQCSVCNYRAAQKEHVLRHLRTQHKIDIKREGKRRKFAKLINLYKHLHTQHGDIMPTQTDGLFCCVVCKFTTSNKKNLLVHMRRHNMSDQNPPAQVYSCVLCRYVNPRRRNLFQHMRKKHNINIRRQEDEVGGIIGTVSQVMTPNTSTVSFTASEMSENTTEVSLCVNQKPCHVQMAGDLMSVASVIKIEDLTRMAGNGDGDGMHVVHTSTHTAEALEGLQALAEQAGLINNIIEEQ
ncbi:unnamed protein product, partial [Candidula unifasciata]